MINVCDAIMGSGKSTACINYMNEHTCGKFIYISPYLDEGERIKKACPRLKFVEPAKLPKFDLSKTKHTAALIKEGKNIATTHQAFKYYTPEMLEDIKNQGYTLFIDEDVSVIQRFEYSSSDLQIAVDAGYIKEEDGVYTTTKNPYSSGALSDMFRLLGTRKLVLAKDTDDDKIGSYWVLTKELIAAFKDVFVLTYLFEAQDLYRMFTMYKIPYEYIWIEKNGDSLSDFKFSRHNKYIPAYVPQIKDKIHIVDSEKLNRIGIKHNALSEAWMTRNKDGETEQLRKNISNCFKHIWEGVPPTQRLWSTHSKKKNFLTGKGFTNAFLSFNKKATNKYSNCTHLVYAMNIYMNVSDKLFYKKMGAVVDEDMYALSTMIQWIWRSAIRNGEEIYIYIPSSRMRDLLTNWIESVSKGGNIIE